MSPPRRLLSRHSFAPASLAAVCGLLLSQAGLAQPASETRESQRTGAPDKDLSTKAKVAPTPQVLVERSDLAIEPRKAEPKVSLSADGQTIYVVGMILDGSFHRFDEVLRSAPRVRTVHLSSAGGYTIEARLMAALVRKRKLDTYVEFYCASACTQIFTAGRQRTIGPAAQLGFHQAVLVNERGYPTVSRPRTDRKLTSTTVFGVNGNDTLRLAYELAGVDPAFIDKALGYSNDNMWLPSPRELIDARVVTRLAEKSELPPAAGGGGSREQVRARLLQNPLWRAALANMPQATEAAIDEVWRTANSGLTLDQAVNAGRNKLISAASRTLGRAPDPVLERALTLYAGAARDQRERGYPDCKALVGETAQSDAADASFEQREDALLIEFMSSGQLLPAMDRAEATRYFIREVMPKLSASINLNTGSSREGKCRLGFQTFEAIDTLPARKRLKAYRALLSLPGLADGD